MDLSQDYRSLKILHSALLAGCMMLIIVLTFIVGDNDIHNIKFPPDIFGVVGIVIAVMSLFFSNFIYKNLLTKIDNKITSEDDFMVYRSACVIRWALLQGSAILNIMFFYTFGNGLLFYVAVTMWLFLFLAKPKVLV